MQIIGDFFNILLFVTMIGSLLTLLFCFLNKVLRLPLPLWLGICCMAAYIVPITAGGTWLIPPEEHGWVTPYYILCRIWAGGVAFLLLLHGVRSFLGFQAFKKCRPCKEKHILDCCDKCAHLAGLRQTPSVFWGELKDSACVFGSIHPAVILNQAVVEHLTDRELTIVLCHEMTHVRRKHMIPASVFDYVCIVNWFNPFAWIMKREFSVLCEMDCDRCVIAALAEHITFEEYAHALLRLLTLSSDCGHRSIHSMGALGFLPAKRRIRQIMARPAVQLRIAGSVLGILGLALAVLLSLHMSRAHFYPYLHGSREYAAAPTAYESRSTAIHCSS